MFVQNYTEEERVDEARNVVIYKWNAVSLPLSEGSNQLYYNYTGKYREFSVPQLINDECSLISAVAS